MARSITVEHDPEADAAFVFFNKEQDRKIARTEFLGDSWQSGYSAEYDASGDLVTLDLTSISKGIDVPLLPFAKEVKTALREAGLPIVKGKSGKQRAV